MKIYTDMKFEILYFATQEVITSSPLTDENEDVAPDFEW